MLIESFADACKQKGISPKDVIPDFKLYPKEHRRAIIAQAKLFIICDVLNDGHKFDYNNYDEYKHYCWWSMDSPGFRLVVVHGTRTTAFVSPRLCFKTRELAEYAAEKFLKLFKDLYVQ